MINNVKRIKNFFYIQKGQWFSPKQVDAYLDLSVADGGVGRRCRELLNIGFLVSKKVEKTTKPKRKYVMYRLSRRVK